MDQTVLHEVRSRVYLPAKANFRRFALRTATRAFQTQRPHGTASKQASLCLSLPLPLPLLTVSADCVC